MKTQANGIGGYKRKKSPSGTTKISESSWARIDAAQALCRQRASAAKTAAQAGAVYQDTQAGMTLSAVEVQA